MVTRRCNSKGLHRLWDYQLDWRGEMKAVWNRTTNRYEIEMSATEQGNILAALGIANDYTGDSSFADLYDKFRNALYNARVKD